MRELDMKPQRFAVLDIETTGLDPAQDSIIDVGYLLIEEGKLVKKYSSLINYENDLSQTIKKLTGIDESMLRKAPDWKVVKKEIEHLNGTPILAHNASFEKSFLIDLLPKSKFIDSMDLLSLVFPKRGSLSLESFLIELKIKEKEDHRGYEDSLDLLKVIISLGRYFIQNKEQKEFLKSLFEKYQLADDLLYDFLNLTLEDIKEISQEIDYDLGDNYLFFKDKKDELFDSGDDKSEHLGPVDFAFSGENIKRILRDQNRLKKINSSYHFRESQESLSLRVGQSFKNDKFSMIQAPTGVGKTLGYLLPSALMNLDSDKKVLVATGTKTLQNQIVKKDIPLLKKILSVSDDDLKSSQLLGSNNHVCELLYREVNSDESALFQSKDYLEKMSKIYFEVLFQNNEINEYENMILGDDIPYVLKKKNKFLEKSEKEFRVDFRSCLGEKCAYKKRCSYIRGLKMAKEADIIVGNHAMMLNWPKSLERPRYVLVDEAHKLEKDALSTFSLDVSEEKLKRLMGELSEGRGLGSLYYLINNELGEASEGEAHNRYLSIKEKSEEFYQNLALEMNGLREMVEKYFKSLPRYTPFHFNEIPMRNRDTAQDEVFLSIFNTFDHIKEHLIHFFGFLTKTYDLFSREDLSDESLIAYARFETFYNFLKDLQQAFTVNLTIEEGYAHSMKFSEAEGFILLSAPIDIGKFIYENFIQETSSTVFTSATLSNMDCSVGTVGIQWGLGYSNIPAKDRFERIFSLPPIFDYQNRAKLILCDDVPAMGDPNFVPTILENLVPLIRNIGGRSLLLFSSRARFDIAREILLEKMNNEIPVFIQGMGSQVVEEYKKAPRGVLLGMESFGEGIDIPGESLQFLFIDKIPDMRMDHVINMRRDYFKENMGNEFQEYYMAERVRGLHQKLGRLLRRVDDFGCAIVAESRVKNWKGKTLRTLEELLKPYYLERYPLSEATVKAEAFIKRSVQGHQPH